MLRRQDPRCYVARFSDEINVRMNLARDVLRMCPKERSKSQLAMSTGD